MATPMTEQSLTLAAAEARLPLVRRIVRDAVNLHQQIAETKERLADMRHRRGDKQLKDIYAEEWLAIEQELDQDADRLAGFVAELVQLGAKLVDLQEGLVAFASERNGRPILLSWKYDEPRVAYWYDMDQGPAQRRLLDGRAHEGLEGPGFNRIEARFDEKV